MMLFSDRQQDVTSSSSPGLDRSADVPAAYREETAKKPVIETVYTRLRNEFASQP
jgi:hypothetical protein